MISFRREGKTVWVDVKLDLESGGWTFHFRFPRPCSDEGSADAILHVLRSQWADWMNEQSLAERFHNLENKGAADAENQDDQT